QDASGQVVLANEAAARLTGYASVAELLAAEPAARLGKFELRDERGQPLSPEYLPGRRALLGESPPETLIRFRTIETGEVRWSMVRATPLLDSTGQVDAVISSFREITREITYRQRLETEHAVAQILAATEDGEAALLEVVQALCHTLEYRFGA